MNQTSLPASRRHLRQSLRGASLTALTLMLGMAAPAMAQSFQGTGTVSSGSASIVTGAGTTDIFLNSRETVIDWSILQSGGGTTTFQTAGTTATFQEGISFTNPDYTVLNRIVPTNAAGGPGTDAISFDGTVNATLFGTTGGNVWFYSPNGIIVGATGSFNVGGLVLTTNPIDTTGGLYGPSGQIRFNGPDGSLAPVTVNGSISALSNLQTNAPAYVAIVAPRIIQGGDVSAEGPIAYVAAEAADITMNAGLFDISVTSGTNDSHGLTHTGSTTGPAPASAGEQRAIYMVAVPKNDGLTMLLGGTMGYAATASNDGTAVILSAGHGLGYDSISDPFTNPASISIGDAEFTSALTATATDTITVAPTDITSFDWFATLNAINAVSLDMTAGGAIQALATDGVPSDIGFPPFGTAYALDIQAGYAENGSTISAQIDNGGTFDAAGIVRMRVDGDARSGLASSPDGTGGLIDIDVISGSFTAYQLAASASGFGNGDGAVGGNGTGGTIDILVNDTLTIDTTFLDAAGNGASAFTAGGGGAGGSATGGVISVDVNGGTFSTDFLNASAGASGGSGDDTGGSADGGAIYVRALNSGTLQPYLQNSLDLSLSANATSGSGAVFSADGRGGALSLLANNGVLDLGSVYLDAIGRGDGSYGQAGSGFGGTADVGVFGTDQAWSFLSIDTSSAAGSGYDVGAIAGSAQGNQAFGSSLRVDGASLAVDFGIQVTSNAYGAFGYAGAGSATAGLASIAVSNGGAISSGGTLVASASADFEIDSLFADPEATPDMNGGIARVTIDNASISVPELDVLAYANNIGGLSSAGSATGGDARVVVSNNGSLLVDPSLGSSTSGTGGLLIDARGTGGIFAFFDTGFRTVTDGHGNAAQGGTALLQLDSGSIDVVGLPVLVNATATGGPAGIAGTDGTSDGDAQGGSATLLVNGGTFTADDGATVQAFAVGGAARNGIVGGDGTGGSALFSQNGGTVTLAIPAPAAALVIDASGYSESVDSAQTGASGNATGGTATLATAGTAVSLTVTGPTQVSADAGAGLSFGTGFAPGSATANIALVRTQSGVVTLDDLGVHAIAFAGAGDVANPTAGRGGQASVQGRGASSLIVNGDLSVDASSYFSAADPATFAGQSVTGGNTTLLAANSGVIRVNGNTRLDARGYGTDAGNIGETAGAGAGGSAIIEQQGTNGIALNGNVQLHAGGIGGDGTVANALGGNGTGGTASILQNVSSAGAITITGNVIADATGVGGANQTGSFITGTGTGGSVGVSVGAGPISIGGNAVFDASAVGGLNPAPFVASSATAGYIAIGTVGTSTGVAIDIGGSLDVSAAGDVGGSLRPGLTMNLNRGSVAVGTDATIDAAGTIEMTTDFGAGFDTAGNLSVTSANEFISTSAANTILTAGGQASFTGFSGVRVGNVDAATGISINSVAGGIAALGLLSSNGNIGVSGQTSVELAAVDAGGTLDVASATGAVSATDFLQTGGAMTIGAATDIALASVNAGGQFAATTPGGLFTASDSVTSTGNLSIAAANGIAAPGMSLIPAVTSGGTTSLVATNGPILIADLRSTGGVTASAISVNIGSGGSLTFADLDATLGSAIVRTTGALTVNTVDAVTQADLRSTGGAVTVNGAINGATIALSARTALATNAALSSTAATSLTSGGNMTLGDPVNAGTTLNISAGGSANVAGVLSSGSALAVQATTGIVTGGTVTSGGSLGFTSGTGITSNAGVSAAGGINFSAGTRISTAAVTSTAGPMAFTAGTTFVNNGALDSGGALTITAPGNIVTRDAITASGTINISGADVSALRAITAGGALGIAATGTLQTSGASSGNSITLSAQQALASGPIFATTSANLTSTGSSVTINGATSADSIAITALTDISTNAALNAVSQITLDAGGAIVTNAAIDPAVLTLTAGGPITVNASAQGGVVSLVSNGDIIVNDTILGTASLSAVAGGTLFVNALLTAPAISGVSGDIAIGPDGQIGQRGLTATVDLANGQGSTTFIGGAPTSTTGGYSLDATELQQLFADQAITISTLPVSTTVGDTIVDDVSISYGSGGQLGSGGVFSVQSPGRIAIQGDVFMATGATGDTLAFSARQVDLVADIGSITMIDDANDRLGTLQVDADRFTVATGTALVDLGAATDMTAINALLDAPAALQRDSVIDVGAMNATVGEGLFIQNMGASTAYADRRGFSANTLSIDTRFPDSRIVINGQTFDTSGLPVTGLDTASTITINGVAASAAGQFDPLSTINGCVIGQSCRIIHREEEVQPPGKPDLDGPLNPSIMPQPFVQTTVTIDMDPIGQDVQLPLVDEPVTSVGNEDLWEGGCSQGRTQCEGESGK